MNEYAERFKKLIVAVLDWQIAVQNTEDEVFNLPFCSSRRLKGLQKKEEVIEELVEELVREIQHLRENS